MQQEPLFHERIEDAIGAVTDRLGRKRISKELWPDKSERDAHNLIDACLNPERKERFTPSQLMFIARKGREAGHHGIVTYLCRELGYADPTPIEPRDELTELLRVSIEERRHQARRDDRIERLLQSHGVPSRPGDATELTGAAAEGVRLAAVGQKVRG